MLSGDDRQLAAGQTSCATTLLVSNRTGIHTCLWQLNPFRVQSCVGGSVQNWDHPISGVTQTGVNYALTTHPQFPKTHTENDYNAGTLVSRHTVRAIPAQSGNPPLPTDPPVQPTGYLSHYLFMDSLASCHADQPQNCYLTNKAQAIKVINSSTKIGVKHFLLPSADLAGIKLFGGELANRGLSYYTTERWEVAAAIKNGVFDCSTYMNVPSNLKTVSRRQEFLDLIATHGTAFKGIMLTDEPSINQFDTEKAVRKCLSLDSDIRISSLDVFLNLFPLYVNENGINNKVKADAEKLFVGALTMERMGYANCSNASLFSVPHQLLYRDQYVNPAAGEIRPTKLAFDMYLQDNEFKKCHKALTDMMQINMTIIQQAAAVVSAEPIAVTQNFADRRVSGAAYPDAEQLNWFASWSIAHGIKSFVYFLSHDMRPQLNSPEDFDGLLDGNNAPRASIYNPTLASFQAINPILNVLRNSTWHGLTSVFLSMPVNGFVHWLPADDVLAGSYQDANRKCVMLS